MTPSLVLGSVAFVAGFVVLLLPETSNLKLPVVVEDVEKRRGYSKSIDEEQKGNEYHEKIENPD